MVIVWVISLLYLYHLFALMWRDFFPSKPPEKSMGDILEERILLDTQHGPVKVTRVFMSLRDERGEVWQQVLKEVRVEADPWLTEAMAIEVQNWVSHGFPPKELPSWVNKEGK